MKCILKPLNLAFNNSFRKIFLHIARYKSLRMIFNGFKILPVSSDVVFKCAYMTQNKLKLGKFIP